MDFTTFLCESLKSFDSIADYRSTGFLQVIHLDQALNRSGNDPQHLKLALEKALNLLSGLQLERITIITQDWSDLGHTTAELGLEQISWFIRGLAQLKATPVLFDLIDPNRLHNNFKQRLAKLAEAITVLDDFGYFGAEQESGNLSLLQGKRVLIVEDMLYNRILLKKILQRYNCTTLETINGLEAVKLWEKPLSFDLVIMDMNMPVMDGFQATQTIRQLEAERKLMRTPIIALTALAMRGDRERCIAAGCDEYMTKPVETGVLLSTCNKVLSGTESAEPAEVEKTCDIQKIVLKIDDQIYAQVLARILHSAGIQFERMSGLEEIQKGLTQDRIDFLVLDPDWDMELGYYVRNSFPDKHVIFITTARHQASVLCRHTRNNIRYPFKREQILSVLDNYAQMQRQALMQAERIADADSFSNIQGQGIIKEAIDKSNQQLAVWQKAFRKIGGDLVLGHQFNLHGKFGFIIGDVSGHDIQSGYTASWFAGLVKGVWGQYSNPLDLLRYLNGFLGQSAGEEDERFVCALVLLWDPLRHKLSYANAGIPAGILVKNDTGKSEMIKWTGIPIGLFPEKDMFDHDEIDFKPGDRLYVATDGVLEAIPGEIISGMGETTSDDPPKKALEAIVDFVTRSIEVNDDLTIAVFEGHELKEPRNGFRRTINSSHADIETVIEQIEQFVIQVRPGRYDMTRVLLAAREALINALQHGNSGITEKPIDIDLELFEKTLEIRISDAGSGFDLLSEKKRLQTEGDLRIHGRGIELMEGICKSVSYTGSGIRMAFAPSILSVEPDTAE